MLRRSPAENYFKYLVVHPDLYDDGYIRDVANELGLDYLGDSYVQWLRQRTRAPRPFHPEDLRHGRSQSFLIREKLEVLFYPTPDMKKAYKILDRARWRELVETLVLSQAPNDAVARALRIRHQFAVSDDVIRLYKYYFWNIDLLDTTDMRLLLDLRYSGVLEHTDDKTRLAQYPALSRLKHNDPRYVAAKLPASPLSAALAQIQMGIIPKNIDVPSVVESTMGVSSLRSWEAVVQGGPMGAQISQGFSGVLESMIRSKESVSNPELGLRAELKQITMATTPTTVPTLHQLTAGAHTTNVHPDPKPEPGQDEDEDVIDAEFEDDEADGNDGDDDEPELSES